LEVYKSRKRGSTSREKAEVERSEDFREREGLEFLPSIRDLKTLL